MVCLALRRLPPETAALLLMRDGEGFMTHEIAEMTEQNYEALRKRLALAREAIICRPSSGGRWRRIWPAVLSVPTW